MCAQPTPYRATTSRTDRDAPPAVSRTTYTPGDRPASGSATDDAPPSTSTSRTRRPSALYTATCSSKKPGPPSPPPVAPLHANAVALVGYDTKALDALRDAVDALEAGGVHGGSTAERDAAHAAFMAWMEPARRWLGLAFKGRPAAGVGL